MQWPIFLCVGLVSGVFGGFFGVGGAVVIIPLLIFAAKFPQHMAQGTSVGALLLPIGALAAWRYWQAGHVDIKASLWIACGFFFGGWLGAQFAQQFAGPNLRRLFGAFLVMIGVKLVLGK